MRQVISEENKIRICDKITINLLAILDKKNISNSNNKIKDYENYLKARTNISLSRIKKLLTLNINKQITINDIDELTKALNVKAIDFFQEIN